MESRLAGLKRNWEVWALAALLLVHVVLGVYWSVAIPIFEAHDEDAHYYFVRYLATEHKLPPPGGDSALNDDEMHQPPLYYILAALPVAFVGLPDEFVVRYNPYIAQPLAQGGRNKVIHDPELERWPYRGDVLAIHLARWVSVLLGSLALVFTYLAARALCPGEPWVRWGAVLVHALWPQFRFTTAVINNDLMMTVSAAAVTWLLVRVVVAPRPSRKDLLALGVAMGLALLSKNNALGLVPVVLVVLCVCVAGAGLHHSRRLVVWAGAGTAAAMVGVGWWYARNLQQGVALFGSRGRITSVGWLLAPLRGQRSLRPDLVLPALRLGMRSLWGAFGWNNVGLPNVVYHAAGAWCALAAIGLVLWLCRGAVRRRVAASIVLLSVAACMLLLPLYIYINEARIDLPGRYLLPAVPALSILIGAGWSALLRRSWRASGWAAVSGGLLLLASLAPVLWIRPAYAAPPQVVESDLAEYAPVRATFGDFAELVGYRIENPLVNPGDTLHASLAWKVLAQTPDDYTLKLKAHNAEDTLGEVWRYPGGGALATTAWQPGYLFVEEVAVPIVSEKADGRQAWLEVRYRGPADVEVRDAQGRSLGVALDLEGIKVRGSEPAVALPEGSVQFGAAIGLIAARVDVQASRALPWLDVDLTWAATARPAVGYTVSVQLRNAQQVIVTQADGQPRQGAYPTSMWEPGERVDDLSTLFLPTALADGRYTLYTCLYDAASGERLGALGSDGRVLPSSEVPLLALTVQGGVVSDALPLASWVDVMTQYAGDRSGGQDQEGRSEDIIAAALAGADRLLAAGRPGEAAALLRASVLPLDPASLPALYRLQQAYDAGASAPAEEPPGAVADRLRLFAPESLTVPADPRLAVYLGEAMAGLADEGIWTHESLVRAVSYQVWQISRSSARPMVEQIVRILLAGLPGDRDLELLLAESYQRYGDLDSAIAAYRQLLATEPGCAAAYLRLGLIHEARGQWSEATPWYEEYRRREPRDLLGLAKLAAAYKALGRIEAADLRRMLETKTDSRHLAAGLLGVPVEKVQVGPDVVENGGFEQWARTTRPRSWAWLAMFSGDTFNRASFAAGPERLAPWEGRRAARIDGFWLLEDSSLRPARAGFAPVREATGRATRINVAADVPYLVTFAYRTIDAEGKPLGVAVSSDRGVFWTGSHTLPATGGAWWQFAAVAWNRSQAEASIRPLLQSFASGTAEFDGLEIRAIALAEGTAVPAGEPRFEIMDGGS